MSAEVMVRISCDEPGCPAVAESREAVATADRQRVILASRGWRHFEGNDYCRDHARRADR